VKFNNKIYIDYISRVPLPLAFERLVEAEIYMGGLSFQRPILDIGCGDGLFARMLFAENIDTGIDPQEVEIAHARAQGVYDELIQCYGNAVPKPDDYYRTVFSNSVLEHISDLMPVLKEAHRVLASGGRFYFTVPSADFERYTVINLTLEGLGLKGLSNRFRSFFNHFWVHYHAYPLERWMALAQEAGFEVVDGYTYNPKRLCLANTILTPLSLPAKILKDTTNRWVFFPPLRRVFARLVAGPVKAFLRGGEKAEKGGLVFLSLQKP
jgi:SAM-dependent methyltransferase